MIISKDREEKPASGIPVAGNPWAATAEKSGWAII